jgi:hypothetical protein
LPRERRMNICHFDGLNVDEKGDVEIIIVTK